MEKDFNNYMESYKKKSLKEKKEIVIDQLKILTAFTNSMCTNLNVDNKILFNKELIDLKSENYTEDDFVEAILVYINSIQNSLNDFNLKLVDVMDFISNNLNIKK